MSVVTNKFTLGRAAAAGGIGGTLLSVGFCVLDFLDVPKAFKSKYDHNGNLVQGKNIKGGFRELGKSSLRCASYLVLPAAIAGLAAGAGVLGASIAGVASFGSCFGLGSVFNKILPYETDLISQACEAKGTDYESGSLRGKLSAMA